jgi:hypothetical protein
MFRNVVSLREKRSTSSQFENVSVGCDIEADNLELSSPEEIVGKTRQLFQMARSAVNAELLRAVPERSDAFPMQTSSDTNGRAAHGAGHANGHGPNGNGHNGNGRSYGRPNPEPSAKQKMLLQRLAQERGLSAEEVGDIARREFGRGVPQLDKGAMSRLLEMLMEQATRSHEARS